MLGNLKEMIKNVDSKTIADATKLNIEHIDKVLSWHVLSIFNSESDECAFSSRNHLILLMKSMSSKLLINLSLLSAKRLHRN